MAAPTATPTRRTAAADRPDALWSMEGSLRRRGFTTIAGADAQRAEQGRRQFMDRLAVLGATYAEQDRQRAAAAAANRPVVCSVTGVYVQNTVVCN